MAKDEIKQVMINDHLVGIVGLDDIIKKTAKIHQNKSDEDIKNILLREITVNNYVPPAVQDAYGHSLLREFKIAQGLLVAEDYRFKRNSALWIVRLSGSGDKQ